MVEASGAMIWPREYLVPAVPLAVLRKGVREVLLWFKAAQDQGKGRGPFLTTPVTALGRQGSPWQIPRPVVLGIGSLMPFAEKKKKKKKKVRVDKHLYKGKTYFQHNFGIDSVTACSLTMMENS